MEQPPPPYDLKNHHCQPHETLHLTCGFTMASLLKQWGNLDLRETREIIYQSKGNNDSFQKMEFLMKMRDWIKSYGYLRKKFGLF